MHIPRAVAIAAIFIGHFGNPAISLAGNDGPSGKTLQLIKEDEARLPDAPLDSDITRDLFPGPRITINQCPDEPIFFPIAFVIEFKTFAGAEIAPHKIKFHLLKKNARVDLKERIMRFDETSIPKEGRVILPFQIHDAEAPVGEYRIRIVVSDTHDLESSKDFRLRVMQEQERFKWAWSPWNHEHNGLAAFFPRECGAL